MSLFFVCRHGERADNGPLWEQEKIEIMHDPHLTELGQKQALSTGFFIKKKVEEAVIDKLISTQAPKYLILTSPFLRCVQTATHIAKALNIDNLYEKSLFIDQSICEILSAGFYKEDVLPELYIRTKPGSDITKYTDVSIKESFITGNIVPKYPETYAGHFQRVEYAYRYIKDSLLGVEAYKDLIVIMVSHGFAVQIVLEVMNEFDFLKSVDYCSTQEIYYPDPVNSKETFKVLVKQHHEQIDEKKEDTIEEIVLSPPKL